MSRQTRLYRPVNPRRRIPRRMNPLSKRLKEHEIVNPREIVRLFTRQAILALCYVVPLCIVPVLMMILTRGQLVTPHLASYFVAISVFVAAMVASVGQYQVLHHTFLWLGVSSAFIPVVVFTYFRVGNTILPLFALFGATMIALAFVNLIVASRSIVLEYLHQQKAASRPTTDAIT